MKHLIASHKHNYYLKPGEVLVSRNPVLVTTVLGSCVAVTMFSPRQGVGAICHAMLSGIPSQDNDLLYVETAVRYLYAKMVKYDGIGDMVVKVFGGAQVIDFGNYSLAKVTVGEQNVAQALEVVKVLGLAVAKADTGGIRGRKLFFSIKNGDVYLRKMGLRSDLIDRELKP
jgi:chemotaxis protein CheD